MMCIVPGSFGSPIPRELRDTELVLGLARGFLAPMRYVVNVLQWGRVTSPVRARAPSGRGCDTCPGSQIASRSLI